MANVFGRQVVLPFTNKSGGQVIAGDVVVLDSTNNDSFTTSTAGAVTTPIGIAQETIASNAVGRVLVSGYAALINVNASVTRGNYGKTHTVAKQATDAGAARVAGTFVWFSTGGATPTGWVYPVDLAGSALTNPMTTVGDIIIGSTAGAPARLAAATSGYVLTAAGAGVAPAWAAAAGGSITTLDTVLAVDTTHSAGSPGTGTTVGTLVLTAGTWDVYAFGSISAGAVGHAYMQIVDGGATTLAMNQAYSASGNTGHYFSISVFAPSVAGSQTITLKASSDTTAGKVRGSGAFGFPGCRFHAMKIA